MNGANGALRVCTCCKDGVTVLDDCYFTPPYKIARPFPQADGGIHLMVMSASAGILEGDRYEEEFHIGAGSRVDVTGQSYAKVFRMGTGRAEKRTRIVVEAGASLRWLPPPVLPFAGSRYLSDTRIEVRPGGALVWRDILSCGRAGSGEVFRFASYRAALTVSQAGRPVLHERTALEPADQPLSGLGYYEGHTHQATLYFFGGTAPDEERLVAALKTAPAVAAGVTGTLEGGRLVRMLGDGAEQLERLCEALMGCGA